MKNLPLRVKLSLWSSLVVAVALLFCSIGIFFYIQHEQIEALDDVLRNEAHTFFGAIEKSKKSLRWDDESQVNAMLPITRTERYICIKTQEGLELFRSKNVANTPFDRFKPERQTVRILGHPVRVGVFTNHGIILYFGTELSEINADSAAVAVGLLIGLPFLTMIVAGGGWWIARTALAPIGDIAIAAEKITADRLNQRLPTPTVQDELGRLSDVLNAMFDRLESSFRQSMHFSANASHELKTPLTILRNTVEELLKSPNLPESEQSLIATLLEQIQRLAAITDGLLLLSRADAGRLALDCKLVNLHELISACVDDAQILANEKDITICAIPPEDFNACVDSGRITQILLNLLENAVKYNYPGGRVGLTVERETEKIVVLIDNTGPGIPSEAVPQIFERFYRSNREQFVIGTGLGLSIARELARAHGGDVTLQRSDSDLTIFRFVFDSKLPPSKIPVRENGSLIGH